MAEGCTRTDQGEAAGNVANITCDRKASMSEIAVAGGLAVASLTFGILLVLLRHRAYRRRIFYDPRQNCVLGVAGPGIETNPVLCSDGGFFLPEPAIEAVSGLLEVEVHASVAGRLSDPAVTIRTDDFRDIQYFERGAQGARFLNISRLLNSTAREQRVHLIGHGVTCETRATRVHVCRERVTADDRVLVIAPHPDDAEIAAFGFYADTRATVVTLTAGDASDRYQNSMQPWISLSRGTVANIRVWDSLTIPEFGGVPAERAINLCLPDGRLREMYLHPDRDLQREGGDAPDFPALRRMNRSSLLQDNAACTWKSFVYQLTRIIADTKPTIVVAPHPTLDPNPDHLFATVALSEALESIGSTAGRMFFCTVHNRRSELWPFGPAGSGVALLPILPDDGVCASGFYSHALTTERQRQKFIALEAMHDLRELQWPAGESYHQACSRIAAELRALAHGMGLNPTSYLRRAVRPDELFFVTSFDFGIGLACQALEQHLLNCAAAQSFVH
jgi:LmbE family N-acetylglucosaminyl deacetylase